MGIAPPGRRRRRTLVHRRAAAAAGGIHDASASKRRPIGIPDRQRGDGLGQTPVRVTRRRPSERPADLCRHGAVGGAGESRQGRLVLDPAPNTPMALADDIQGSGVRSERQTSGSDHGYGDDGNLGNRDEEWADVPLGVRRADGHCGPLRLFTSCRGSAARKPISGRAEVVQIKWTACGAFCTSGRTCRHSDVTYGLIRATARIRCGVSCSLRAADHPLVPNGCSEGGCPSTAYQDHMRKRSGSESVEPHSRHCPALQASTAIQARERHVTAAFRPAIG